MFVIDRHEIECWVPQWAFGRVVDWPARNARVTLRAMREATSVTVIGDAGVARTLSLHSERGFRELNTRQVAHRASRAYDIN